MRKILLSLMLLLTTTVSFSQKLPDYDPSHRWVTDLGGLFTPEQNNQIYQMLDQYEKQTSIEIAVLTVCDFESSPEDFSQKTAEKWGVGKKGVNNGIFIMISKCKVPHVFRVDIGYGLEGYLPDGWVKLQQDSIKIKYLQKSQYFEGTVALINKFTTKIGIANICGFKDKNHIFRHRLVQIKLRQSIFNFIISNKKWGKLSLSPFFFIIIKTVYLSKTITL